MTYRPTNAHLLTKGTIQGWHVTRWTSDVCCRCHQPRHLWADLCPSFLTPIEAATRAAHDPPPPEGRLF